MKYRLMLMAVAVATAFLALPIMAATTWYVNGTTGSDSYIGTSESSAKATIQAAIDVSSAGDTILVAPGTYAPIVTANKRIAIKSSNGPAETLIDGSGSMRCATLHSGDGPTYWIGDEGNEIYGTMLIGFTLKNGSGPQSSGGGGGVFGGTLEDCVVSNCFAYGCGGCYASLIKRCKIVDNMADDDGGGIGHSVIYDSLVIGNRANNSGGGKTGGGVSRSKLVNCTVSGNVSVRGNSSYWGPGSAVDYSSMAYNCIIYGNTYSDGLTTYNGYSANVDEGTGEGSSLYNCITSNPNFVDAANGDYRLAAGSPCIDAGDNSYVTSDKDLAGNARIVNGTVDIGCYEYISLTDGLVAYYPFDGNANDASGNENHGTTHGVTITTDRFGNENGAYYFGDGKYIWVPCSESLNSVSNSLTVAAWVRIDDWYGNHWAPIVCKGRAGWAEYSLNLTFARNETIVGENINADFAITPVLGKWSHVAVVYGADHVCYAYVDGVCVGTKACTATFSTSATTNLEIGKDYPGETEYLLGALDDVLIYNRALSAAEVKALYDGTPVSPTTTYMVTFDPNGGSLGVASTTREVEDGKAIGTLPDATREGYTLAGWFTDANGGAQISENTIVTNDVTYYAQWEPISYTVAFNANGGLGAMDAIPCVYGEGATIPGCVFRRVGYAFEGWSLDSDATVAYLPGQDASRLTTQAGVVVTLYAVWRHGCDGIWSIGGDADWFAESVDEPHEGGYLLRSGAIGDGQEAWIETVVTNDCRVSFDWKSSCEPLLKGRPYDYLAFAVDGNQVGFICGETGWTSETFCVTGEGEHSLRWTFQKDDQDSAGEDCAWIANVKVVPSVTQTFADGGATAGTAPEPMAFYADDGSAVFPGCGTLVKAKHTFAGWNYGENVYAAGTAATNVIFADGATVAQGMPPYQLVAVWSANTLSAPVIVAPETYEVDSATVTITADEGATIYYTLDGSVPNPARPEAAPYQGPFEIEGSAVIRAIAVKDNYYDSEEASFTVTRPTWTFGEYLNCPERTFTTGGDSQWVRAKGVSDDGYALRSGAVGNNQTSRLETVVYGAGTIAFRCKVDGEVLKKIVFDGLAFCIDGVQQGDLIGENTWSNQSFTVTGDGKHTLSWLYVKDEEGNGDGEDCAWLDNVVWTANDPLPLLDVAATDNDAKAILGGLSDVWLSEKIVGTSGYTVFRSWVDGKGLSHVLVGDAPNAWLSYALDAPGLMVKDAPLANEDVVIESIVPSAVAGAFDLVVNIADSEIGEGARLAEVFGVEGATELNESMFSSDNVSVTLERTADGKARFTVTRRLAVDGSPHQSGNSFFMRVKVK